jgi:hypothetical protein
MGLGALDLFHIVNQIRNTYVIENIGLIILKQPLTTSKFLAILDFFKFRLNFFKLLILAVLALI